MLKLNASNGSFINSEWRWDEWVPGQEGKTKYQEATWAANDKGGVAVYDGATNYRGTINADGTMEPNDPGNDAVLREMNMTFLRTCLASLS